MNPLDTIYAQFQQINALTNNAYQFGSELLQDISNRIIAQGAQNRAGAPAVEDQLVDQYQHFLTAGRYQNGGAVDENTTANDLLNRFTGALRQEIDTQINNTVAQQANQPQQGQLQQITTELNNARQNLDTVFNNLAAHQALNQRLNTVNTQVTTAHNIASRVNEGLESRNYVEQLLLRISGGTLTLDQQYIDKNVAINTLNNIDYNREFGNNADYQRMAGNVLINVLNNTGQNVNNVSPKSIYQEQLSFYQDLQKSRTIVSNASIINTSADKLNKQYGTIQNRLNVLYNNTANPYTPIQITEGDDVSRIIKNMFGTVQYSRNQKNATQDPLDRKRFINKLEGVTIPAGENDQNINRQREQYADFILFQNTPANQQILPNQLSGTQQLIINQAIQRSAAPNNPTVVAQVTEQTINGFRQNRSIVDLFNAYGVRLEPTEKLVQQEKAKLEKQNVAGTQVDMFNKINQVLGTSQKQLRSMQQTTNIQEIQLITTYTQLGTIFDQSNATQYQNVENQITQMLNSPSKTNQNMTQLDDLVQSLQRDYEQQGYGTLNEDDIRTALKQWISEDVVTYGQNRAKSTTVNQAGQSIPTTNPLGIFVNKYRDYTQKHQGVDIQKQVQDILSQVGKQQTDFKQSGDVIQFNKQMAGIRNTNDDLFELFSYMPDMYEDVMSHVSSSLYSRLSKLPSVQGNQSKLEQMNVFQNAVQQQTYYNLKTVGQFDNYLSKFLGPDQYKLRELTSLLPRSQDYNSTIEQEINSFQDKMRQIQTSTSQNMLDQLRAWVQEETKSNEPQLVSDLLARLSNYQHRTEVQNTQFGQTINQILQNVMPETEWFNVYQNAERTQYQISDIFQRQQPEQRDLKRELLNEIRTQFNTITGGEDAYNEIVRQLDESATGLAGGFNTRTLHGIVYGNQSIAGTRQLDELNQYVNSLVGIQQFQYTFVDREAEIGKGIMRLAISDVQKVLDKQANEPVYSLTVSLLTDQVRNKRPWTAQSDIDYQTLSIFQTQFENPFLQHPELINKDYVNQLLSGTGMTFESLSQPDLTDQGRKDFFAAMLFGMYKNISQTAKPTESTEQLYQRALDEFLKVLKDDEQVIKTLSASPDDQLEQQRKQQEAQQRKAGFANPTVPGYNTEYNDQLKQQVKQQRDELVQGTMRSLEYVHMLDQYSKKLGSQHESLYDLVSRQIQPTSAPAMRTQPTLWQGIVAQQNITRQSLSPSETYKTVQFVRGNKGAEEQFNLMVSGELSRQLQGGQYKRVVQALTGDKFTPGLNIIDQMPTNVRTKMIDMLEKGKNQISNARMEELQNIEQFAQDPAGVINKNTGLDDYTKYQGTAYATGFYIRGSGTENDARAALFISVPENPFARTPLYRTQSTQRGIRDIQRYFFQPGMESELQTEQILNFGSKLGSAQDLMYASYMGGQPIGFYKPVEHKQNDLEFGTAFLNGYSYKMRNEQFKEVGRQFADQTYQQQLAMRNQGRPTTTTELMMRTFEKLRQLTIQSEKLRNELPQMYIMANELLPASELNNLMTQKNWSMTVQQFDELIEQFQRRRKITGDEARQLLYDEINYAQNRIDSLFVRGRDMDIDIMQVAQNMWSPTNLKVQGMNITVQPPNRQDFISLSTPNRPGQVQQIVPEGNVTQPTQQMLNAYQSVTDLVRAVNQYYQRAPMIRLFDRVPQELVNDRTALMNINQMTYITQELPNMQEFGSNNPNATSAVLKQDTSLILPTMVISKNDEETIKSIIGTHEILEGDMYMLSKKFRNLFGYERATRSGQTELTRFSEQQTLKFVGPERSKGMQNVEFDSELYFQIDTPKGPQYVPIMLIMNEQPSRHNKLSQIGQGMLRAQRYLGSLNYRAAGTNQQTPNVNITGLNQQRLSDVQQLQDVQIQLQSQTTLPVFYRNGQNYVSAGFNAQFILHDVFTDISQENWQELKGGSIMYAQTFQQFQTFGIENLVSSILNVDDPMKNQMFYIQNKNMQPFVQHGMSYQIVSDKVQRGQIRFDERFMNLESQYGMIYEGQQNQYKTGGKTFSLAGQLEPWNKTIGRYVTSYKYQDNQQEQLNVLQNQLSQYNSRGQLNTTAQFIRTMQEQLQGSRETTQLGQNLVRLDVDTQRKLANFIGEDIYMPDPVGGWLMELFSQTKTFSRLENPEFKLSTDMLNVARIMNVQRKQGQYKSFDIQGQNLLFTRMTVDDFIKVENSGIYLDLGAETLQNLFQGVYSFMYNSTAQLNRQMDVLSQQKQGLPMNLIKQKSRLQDQQTENFKRGVQFNQNRQLTYGQSVVSQFAKRFTKDQGVFITGLHSTQSDAQGGIRLPRHSIENILIGGQYFIESEFQRQIDTQIQNNNTQLANQIQAMQQQFIQASTGNTTQAAIGTGGFGARAQRFMGNRQINQYQQTRYQDIFRGYLHEQIYIDYAQGAARVGQHATITMINNQSTGINRTGLFENLRSTIVHLKPLLDQTNPEEQVQLIDENDPTSFLQFQVNVYNQLEQQYDHFTNKHRDLSNMMNSLMTNPNIPRTGDQLKKARLNVQNTMGAYNFVDEQKQVGEMIGFIGRDPILGQTPFVRFVGLSDNTIVVPKSVQDLIGGDDDGDIIRYLPNILISNRIYNDTYLNTLSQIMNQHTTLQNASNTQIAGTQQAQALTNQATSAPQGYTNPISLSPTQIDMYRSDIGQLVKEYVKAGWYIPISMNNRTTGNMTSLF